MISKKLSELYDPDKLSIKEEVELLSILWQKHNNLGNKKNEKQEKDSISAWIDVINRSFNNVNILLFTNFYYSPFKPKQKKTMSFSEESERVNAMRRRELNKIRTTMNGYTEIISEIIHDDYNWGIFIATNGRDETYEFAEKLLEKQKYATVAGIIDGQSKYDDRIAIFSKIAKENRVKLLGYINSDISDILNENELTEYWSNKTMINYSDKAYNALLKYNPKGLLYYHINNQTSNIDKIVNILQAINNTTIDQYETSDCEWEINRLSELYEDKNDKQLEQEIALSLMRGHIKCANNQCDRYYFYHIRELFKLVNSRDKYLAHDIFEIQIPKEAYTNKEKQFSILDEINSKDKMVLAKIIANSMLLLQNGNEEEALFEYLERIDGSDEVIKDIASAINMLENNGTRRNNKRRRINYKEIINNYKINIQKQSRC